jgi:hypothetical protein
MECSTLPAGFWPNLAVQIFVAVGTVGAVVVALFGGMVRSRFLRLELSIDKVEGVPARVALQYSGDMGGMQTRLENARFYHIRVSNRRRWLKAHEVRVLLLQIEEPGPNGVPQVRWSGESPVVWENQQLYPVGRTIGASARADMCSIVKGKWLQLHPMIPPLNMEWQRTKACDLTLTFQARSDDGDSPPLRVRVAWDGEWSDGAREMRQHLTVESV